MSDDELAGLPNGLSRAGGIFSRRRLLGTTTLAVAGAALAAGQQASAQQPQSVRIGEHNASASDPGPENEALALRELHWHPNADEWQYYIQGSGRPGLSVTRAIAMLAAAGKFVESTIRTSPPLVDFCGFICIMRNAKAVVAARPSRVTACSSCSSGGGSGAWKM
jgi:hypothetical protein